MVSRRLAACGLWVLLLAACATPPASVPQGPSALIADSAVGGGMSGGGFFYVAAVDGQPMAWNNLRLSLQASSGRGADLQVRPYARYVAAGRHRLQLRAQHAFAAPIQSLFSSAAERRVEGEIEVELRADGRYRVAGVLDALRREVWLEEADSGQRVGAAIVAAPDPKLAEAMAGADYTCCNLRYEGDWISDANWVGLPLIAPGARIKLRSVGSNRADVLIDGRPMRIGLDYSRGKQSVEQLVSRLAAKEDPRTRLAGWPPAVRSAIEAGRVMPGMTRPQVLMSLGPPRLDTTENLDAPRWRYWMLDETSFDVLWDAEGRVARIDAPPAVLQLVEHRP